MARSARIVAMLLAATMLCSAPLATGAAAATGGVSLSATLDGHAAKSGSDPIKLSPSSSGTIVVTIRNNTDKTIEVRTVRLAGRVMGLVFFAYDTSVQFSVPSHTEQTHQLVIDLTGLHGQATGLVPAEVDILGPGRNSLASRDFVVDVRGSIWSLYGFFGLAILALTIIWSTGVMLALARGTLHPNRWRRAMRFLVSGLGIGLVFVFTLSALRIVAPTAGVWIPTVVGAATVLFIAGYLTPTPGGDGEDDNEIEDAYDEDDGIPRHGHSVLPVEGP